VLLEKCAAVINKILPFTCILCKKLSDRRQDLCTACLNDLPIVTQKCPRCAQKITENTLCGACLKSPPPFAATYALFAYEFPIPSFILNLKFHHHLPYARILGELMAEKIQQEWYSAKPLPDFIMPIPLHNKRHKERGFNQAVEIARPIAKKYALKIDTHSAIRIYHTPAQMVLSALKRKQNIKNAFTVKADLSGKSIAILDDVITTGSTVTELSWALLKQGAKSIEVWCCARA